ncbi:hypothetical protein BT96DRAFT_1014168 [Gymnopus androsaceus JB14]|uniref:MAPEG-domain-containing protein n=1 Tax=Gymnopus androsaceus JB14 TaxID=1447944 RepID=A0A6A4I5S5_9AGAR|nr:hypothetical protein BT96DRAFT_1014168 [Gymnopus androsaceus JB14]
MSSVIEIPQGSSYVAVALLSTVVLLYGQSMTVSKFRSAAGIKYPQAYAELKQVEGSPDALKFNCAQRAHQNTLRINAYCLYNVRVDIPLSESASNPSLRTLIAALKLPKIAAAGCAVWTVGRALYTRGYVTGEPANRSKNGGALHYLGLLVLLGTSFYSAGSLIMADIARECWRSPFTLLDLQTSIATIAYKGYRITDSVKASFMDRKARLAQSDRASDSYPINRRGLSEGCEFDPRGGLPGDI